ncbi:integrator complex subunit 4-like [Amphiura filiformis]|uniref:integrator complex subunit 4-like n=1 Tax=Amphiura filiformis TaxID=82378 RepID=UPI003B2129ED
MAAHLKKRAYEEYSQVVEQDESQQQQPPAKLRLVQAAKPSPSLQLDLRGTTTSHEALSKLVEFGNKLPITADHTDGVVRSLLEYYCSATWPAVRAKIVMLLGDLARTPGYKAASLAEDLLALVAKEESHKVKAQLFSTLSTVGKSLPLSADLHRQMVDSAHKSLNDTSHVVRSECLSLIGALGIVERQSKKDDKKMVNLQRLLGEYTNDIDPRVRSSAFKAMICLHQRGQKLDFSLYDQVCSALTDDYEGVRLAALKLVWVLSQVYPEELVPVPGSVDETLRLIDDGFAKICQMVTDLSMTVRTEAAGLLGSLHLVSPKFLEQTLDKKLMSGLRRKTTAHERQKESYEAGEWSSGQKWADDAPKEQVDPDKVSLINTGACGAFVHGLEDEFLEVRLAAVDSLCELASHSPSFANTSLDFLVDMFNDEIESVRLNAIHSLRKISSVIILREDQLEIILNVLDDFAKEIREGVHDLLCTVKLATKSCLNSALQYLIRNLNKYPQDRVSIWKCVKHLGLAHPDLTLTLVPEFLGTHPYFDTPEPDMDDPAYIAVMVLIFNSASKSPTMMSLFPEYTMRHYSYLRDSLPHLVPEIKQMSLSIGVGMASESAGTSQESEGFLQDTMDKIKALDRMDRKSAITQMQLTISDLDRVGHLKPRLAASAEFSSLYIQCQLVFAKALSDEQWGVPAALCPQQYADTATAAADRVLELSHQLEHLFLGCSLQEMASILQLRLRSWTLQLVIQLRGRVTDSSKSKSTHMVCEQYLQRLTSMHRLFVAHSLQPDSFTQALFSEMHKLAATKSGILAKFLQPLLIHTKVPSLILSNKVCRATAAINEPIGGSDNPLRFTAGLALSVFMDCQLENVQDLQRVQVQVRFPDGQVQLFTPRMSDFRSMGPLSHRLMTDIYLSHGMWSDPCQVEVSLVMTYDPNIVEISGSSVYGFASSSSSNRSDSQGALELCKPVKLYVMPRAAKR